MRLALDSLQNGLRSLKRLGQLWRNQNLGGEHKEQPKTWTVLRPNYRSFFEDGRGRTLTVNSERYVEMLDEFFVPQLQNFPGYNQRTWFQQDGATSHTSNRSLPRVREFFPNKLISRRGDTNRPPRSPDLTHMDFFLWGYVKSKVYANKPTSLAQLKENIRHEMAAITETTCRAVIGNFSARLNECRERNGLHLDDVISKK